MGVQEYPIDDTYDPCTSLDFLMGIWCENGHIVLWYAGNSGYVGNKTPACLEFIFHRAS